MNIIVNGRPHETGPVEAFSYEDVVELVRGRGATPNGYTVTYDTRNRGAEQHAGSLVPGASVRLEEGMVFNAFVTSNA